MSPTAHVVAAAVLTALRVALLAVALVDWAVALILWLPPAAPWPASWAWQAAGAAGGYLVASVLFWAVQYIPVKRRPGQVHRHRWMPAPCGNPRSGRLVGFDAYCVECGTREHNRC